MGPNFIVLSSVPRAYIGVCIRDARFEAVDHDIRFRAVIGNVAVACLVGARREGAAIIAGKRRLAVQLQIKVRIAGARHGDDDARSGGHRHFAELHDRVLGKVHGLKCRGGFAALLAHRVGADGCVEFEAGRRAVEAGNAALVLFGQSERPVALPVALRVVHERKCVVIRHSAPTVVFETGARFGTVVFVPSADRVAQLVAQDAAQRQRVVRIEPERRRAITTERKCLGSLGKKAAARN
jgi:hypothetical protein